MTNLKLQREKNLNETPEGLQPKSRLVAPGFEENCLNKNDKSPTCPKSNLQAMLVATVQIYCYLRFIDIKIAFLQREKLNQIFFIKPLSQSNFHQNVCGSYRNVCTVYQMHHLNGTPE